MLSKENVLRLEKALANSTGIAKSRNQVTQEDADIALGQYATVLKSEDSKLSSERAYSLAMDACPTLAGLAMGKSLEMARGSYD